MRAVGLVGLVRPLRLLGLAGSISLLAGCAGGPTRTAETYVVQPRDTLYSIAWRHDLDYRDLARWNRIGADYRITVGEVLILKPGARRAASGWPTLAERETPRAPSAPSGTPGAPGPSGPSGSPALREPSSPGAARPGQPCGAGAQSWEWPTAHGAPPRPVPGGGILLLGTLGQPIRAACAGRVVYAGNGIRGYGNLIIIKHGDEVLSAYAHTIDPTVREGQEVAEGERIASMGSGAHDIAALYFEIRLNGKPIDPLPLLPAE